MQEDRLGSLESKMSEVLDALRDSFLSSLGNRDPEVIYAILALSARFAEDQYRDSNDLAARTSGYTEVARSLVMRRCANLASESHVVLSPAAREERRRCFWSICLLKRLHGMEFDYMDLPDGSFPPYPESPSMPQSRSPNDMTDGARTTDLKDQGIVAYVIMLSEVFVKTARYYFEEKSFMVSDPFLGYSAAVVATIELQLSFTENPTIRQEKRDRFLICVSFVQKLGQKWPYMARLAK
ncbi:hypothetical protein APSETT445_008850 [Aspergillus pseudonomiae]